MLNGLPRAANKVDLLQVWLIVRYVCQGLFIFSLVVEAGYWMFLNSDRRSADVADSHVEENLNPATIHSWEYYASVLSGRNLFGATVTPPKKLQPRPPRVPAVAVIVAPPVHVPTLTELASDLSLTGIVNDGQPEAAIKNAKTDDVLYVTVGQQIGDITVSAIDDGKVTLSFHGETLDLSL